MGNATGVETVTSLNSTKNDTVTNLQSLADIFVDGSSNDVTATYADSLVTADGSASVEVKGGATLGTLTVSGVTTANEFKTLALTSSGSSANTIETIAADNAGNDNTFGVVTVTGGADITLGTTATDLDATSVDANGLEGDLTLFVGSPSTTGNVTGGSGDDEITISDAATFFGGSIAPRTVDFGAGTDTLNISTSLTDLSASGSNTAHTVSNLDTLALSKEDSNTDEASATYTIDADVIDGLSTIDVSLDNKGEAGGIDLLKGVIDDITTETIEVTAKEGADAGTDVVNLDLELFDGSAANSKLSATLDGDFGVVTAVDADNDDATDSDEAGAVETVALTAADDLTVDKLAATGAYTVNLSGTNAVKIDALDLGSVDTDESTETTADDKVSIDASSLSGDLDLTKTEAGVYEFKTGTASNTIDLGTNATDTTVTGNGTSDEVTLTNTNGDNTIDLTTTAVDTVTFGTVSGGTDTLDLANVNADATIKVVDGDASGGKDAAFSNINGQAFDVVVASGDDFSSATTELGLAEGASGATVTLSGENTGNYAGTLKTSGTLTVDQQIADESGDFANESIALAGASSDDQLTGFVLKGGGTDASSDSTTVTLTGAGDDVALTSLDATSFTGDLDVSDASGSTNLFDQAVSPATIDLGGSGVLTVRAEDLLRDQLDINGGTGETTVAATGVGASGSTTSLRPDLASVETLDLTLVETDASSGDDTAIDLRDSADVTTVVLDVADQSSSGDDFANDLTISDLANNGTVQIAATASGDTSIGSNTKGLIIDSPVNSATTATVTNTGSTENVILGANNASGGGVAVGSTYTDLTVDQVTDNDLTIGTVSGDGVTTLDLNNNTASGDGTLKVNALSTSSLATLTIDSSVGAVNVLDIGTVDSLETLTIDTGDSSGGNTTIGSGSSSSIDTITASGTGDFEITALTASDLDLIDAAEVSGNVTLGSSSGALTTAADATINTGAGADTVSVNVDTIGAIDLGTADGINDELILFGAQGSGTGEIDLSQSGDQILEVNGFGDSAVQTNIEDADVSNVTSSNSHGWKITATEGGSTITGSDYNDEIIGGAGKDELNGGDGNDTIRGGGGDDTITGGAGDDDIALGDGDTAADTVIFGDSAANNGEDTITQFETGTDELNVDAMTTETAVTEVTGELTTTADNVYYLTGDLNVDTGVAANAATALDGAATWTDADATAYFVIADNGTTGNANSAVYQWDDTSASADGVAEGELTLMATVDAEVESTDVVFA